MSVDGFNTLISKFRNPKLKNAYKVMQDAEQTTKEGEIIASNPIIINLEIVAKAIKQAVKGISIR